MSARLFHILCRQISTSKRQIFQFPREVISLHVLYVLEYRAFSR